MDVPFYLNRNSSIRALAHLRLSRNNYAKMRRLTSPIYVLLPILSTGKIHHEQGTFFSPQSRT